ncbi:hypothetical protein [Mycoplasma nasistruthionis]|uniref:DUF1934 family protein n=1 Tax=Mycoplasma nasistruthionis TaxID=353852 RepID=A0A5B7XUF7_9MOLU|nr:hypothetical protein [Mycoplasma nasistruthionis]QCZ36486.1 hypothetical protein FG904_00385 [Mycoplasma nasistruthionis]
MNNKIKFKSVFTTLHDNKQQIIQFDAPLTIEEYPEEGFKQLIFNEPKLNQKNIIELYDNKAIFYTDNTTVELLQEGFGDVTINLTVPNNPNPIVMNWFTKVQEFTVSSNYLNFKYQMYSDKDTEAHTEFDLQIEIYQTEAN